MKYDILLCEGEGCERRNTCRRYLLCKKFLADNDKNKKGIIVEKRENPSECYLYMKKKFKY